MNSSRGKVYLVGAGPGDPGLLTLRGAELLAQADLVLYDGLVNPLLLSLAVGPCERTARTRSGGHAIVPQGDINRRLIEEARSGKIVVRLKGGDPYIFGRGSEEAAALQEAGIPFEVVPGITAATAAGVYAGFSYTHRDTSSAVAFVTGHETPERENSHLDFEALARFPGTLVFYMGLARLRSICSSLIESGKAPTTPAAVVSQATLPQQRTVTGDLRRLADLAEAAALRAPSLIVVGECVNQRTGRSWFEALPLAGVRIGITRPGHQAGSVIADVVRQGGQPVLMPMVEILPPAPAEADRLDHIIDELDRFDWLIFTSANGVQAFLQRVWETGRDLRAIGHLKVAAVGQSTADKLATWSIRPDVIPRTAQAEDLAAALGPFVKDRRCLWPSADRARPVLAEQLLKAGAVVEQLVVYRNVDASISDALQKELRENPPDWVGLSSPAIARRTAQAFPHWTQPDSSVRFAAISPLTSRAAREAGLAVQAEAEQPGWTELLAAIARSANSTSQRDSSGGAI